MQSGICAGLAGASKELERGPPKEKGRVSGPFTPALCDGGFDEAQTGVSSGASFTVPGTGTITSWSHLAVSGDGQNS